VLTQVEADQIAVSEDRIEVAGMVKRQPLLPLAGFISGQPALTSVTGACSQFLDGDGAIFAHGNPWCCKWWIPPASH
jgi:hypothetical protein